MNPRQFQALHGDLRGAYLRTYTDCLDRGLRIYAAMVRGLAPGRPSGSAKRDAARARLAEHFKLQAPEEKSGASASSSSSSAAALELQHVYQGYEKGKLASQKMYWNRITGGEGGLAIYAINNRQPDDKAHQVKNSDVLAVSLELGKRALSPGAAAPLTALIRTTVVNPDAKQVVWACLRTADPKEGETLVFGRDSIEYYALLGTPNLQSAAYMVADHGDLAELRQRAVEAIRVHCTLRAKSAGGGEVKALPPAVAARMARGQPPPAPKGPYDPSAELNTDFQVHRLEAVYVSAVAREPWVLARNRVLGDIFAHKQLGPYFEANGKEPD